MEVKMTTFFSDKEKGEKDKLFSVSEAQNVLKFHQKLAGYEETPLCRLSGLADELGLSEIYVKDESKRFGLNAFKSLGGSYAVGRVISQKVNQSDCKMGVVPENTITFVTATDGNHGRGVAWAAKNLSQKAVVYMPKGSSMERLENIRALGAEAEITKFNYDDTVRFAKEQAEKNKWVLIQDTSWKGYETIPTWIMQGYMTMALEAVTELKGIVPTHVFLQAGVGAMAGAVTGFLSSFYQEKMPKVIIVEPEKADCLYRTAFANDGSLQRVGGDLDSIMAGLCCGEVCTIGWEVLKHHADYFFACPDYIAADGMRVLGNPIAADERIISGESGAVTTGLLYNLMKDKELENFRQNISLDKNSVVLCFSTEGDTDKTNYRHIVWDGWYRKSEIHS